MATSSTGSRRRSTQRQLSAEDQALTQVAKEAESRLAARRAVRNEARDIRSRELERQKREEEEREKEKEGKSSDRLNNSTSRYTSNTSNSRCDSDDSEEETGRDGLKKELLELEDKYKKVMMSNAQLDNEKLVLRYQVELLRDQVDEQDEQGIEVVRELKEKSRELELKKHDCNQLVLKCSRYEDQLQQRDTLIQEHGLVFISDETLSNEEGDGEGVKSESSAANGTRTTAPGTPTTALISPEMAEILSSYTGSLDDRLRSMIEDKKALEKEVRKLKQQLEDEHDRRSTVEKYATSHSPHGTPLTNGPTENHQTTDSQTELQN